MKQILGTNLLPATKARALAIFSNRYTGQHKPCWARALRPDGTAYPVQFADDADWLAHSTFTVRDDGTLSSTFSHCDSNPTWPNDPGLRRPNLDIVIE